MSRLLRKVGLEGIGTTIMVITIRKQRFRFRDRGREGGGVEKGSEIQIRMDGSGLNR